MKDIFHSVQKPYNLRNYQTCKYTMYFGTEGISSLAPKIWEIVPCEIKNAKSLDISFKKIKLWKTDKCPWRLCRRYIGKVGFLHLVVF